MIITNPSRHLIYQRPPTKKRIIIGNCGTSISAVSSVSHFLGSGGGGGGGGNTGLSSVSNAGPSGTHPFRHQFDYRFLSISQ